MYQCYSGYYDGGTLCGNFDATFSTDAMNYWERSFFQRLRGLIEFNGLPENGPGQIGWDYDAFLYQLFRTGYATVFKSKTYGLVVQPAFPTGYGLQYQPRGMQISTTFFNFPRPLEIGKECAVIKLTPDYQGTWDLVTKYAREMQLAEIAIRQSAINARFAYAAIAKDDKGKRTMEGIFSKLANGAPAVVINADLKQQLTTKADGDFTLPIMQFDRDLSKNFILPDLMEYRRNILCDFYRELGVSVQPNKKERMVVTESKAADAETFNRREVWRITLEKSLAIVNEMYDTDITFKMVEPDFDAGEADETKTNNEGEEVNNNVGE
jgi:hypothetical protein